MDPIIFTSKLTAYDNSMDYLITFYDNLPYVRNWNYCNESTIGLLSGNVIKFFQYSLKEPVLVENHDELTSLYLQKLQNANDSGEAIPVQKENDETSPDSEKYDESDWEEEE